MGFAASCRARHHLARPGFTPLALANGPRRPPGIPSRREKRSTKTSKISWSASRASSLVSGVPLRAPCKASREPSSQDRNSVSFFLNAAFLFRTESIFLPKAEHLLASFYHRWYFVERFVSRGTSPRNALPAAFIPGTLLRFTSSPTSQVAPWEPSYSRLACHRPNRSLVT